MSSWFPKTLDMAVSFWNDDDDDDDDDTTTSVMMIQPYGV